MNTIEHLHPTGRTAMDPIAVIGLGCRLPKAPDPEALWNLLIQGKSGISETPPDRWSVDELYDPLIGAPGKMNTRWGGFIDDIERFDAQFFGIAPREANEMDPQQRALLEVAWAALERGGIRPSSLSGTRTGVYVGIGGNDYSHRGLLLDAHLERINPYTGVGNAHSIAANRLSYFLDLRGPSVAVDTACSSSLVAVHLACASLLARESDVALAGGVNALLSPEVSIAFSHAHMLAGDGRCKAFDASADGYVRGEGCGIVVLKRLADAQRDGNRVFAVIRGVAVNQDGRSNGLTAPNGVAQEAVIRAALRAAGLQPSDIGYVEAHGTGTPLGDPIEMRALTAVLSEGRSPENVCAVGSIKTNIGHLETASGIAGLVKSILALEREQIPPHLHLRKLNELMGLTEGTFVIPREARPWPRGERPRRAGVSSYGFGGTNAHVIVEEAPRAAVCASPESAAYLLCLSARTERSLKRLATAFADDLTRRPDLDPAAVCSTVGLGRDHFAAHRLAVAGASLSELTEKLACLADGRAIPGAWEAAPPPGRRRVAFLFSGQGFQVTGMGRELYVALAAFRDTIEHCARILDPLLGVPLAALLFDDVESARLHQTRFAQPALFAFEYALFVTWKSWGVQPDVVLGHSLGELVAATAAGALELEDALRLVSERARLMQALPAGGGMLAVAADEQQVVRALSRFPSLSVAAVNGPENVVVSGDISELTAIAEHFKTTRVGTLPLQVSCAFHSRRMEPMLAAFEELARKVRYAPPAIPMVSNLTGSAFAPGEGPSASYFTRHIRSPVRFAEGLAAVHAMDAKSSTALLELGPSTVLTDIGRRSGIGSRDAYVPSLRTRSHLLALFEAVGALYARGIDVDWKRFYAGRERTPVPLPTYPFDGERFWHEERPATASRVTAARSETHPLLGRKLALAIPAFESRLSLKSHPWLGDHRVEGGVVVPAAAYVALGLAAARTLLAGEGRALVLSDASFVRPIALGEDSSCVLQVVATPDALGEVSIAIYSAGAADAHDWTLHSSSHVGLAPARDGRAAAENGPWREALDRCPAPVGREELYSRLAASGLHYGPQFRGVAEAWVGDGEAVGRLEAPQGLAVALRQSWLHPAVLDAAFHLVAVAASSTGASGTFVPVGMKSLRLERESPFTGDLWVVATLKRGATSSLHLESDLALYDAEGHELARIEGMAAEQLRAAEPASPVEGMLYEVHWERAEPPIEAIQAGPASRGGWIVLSDEGGVAERIAQRIEAAGAVVARIERRKGAGPSGRSVDPGQPEELARAFATIRQEMPEIGAILNCWTLDAEASSAADLDASLDLGPIAVLHVTQAIAQAEWDHCPRLWVLTASAVAIGGGGVSVAQAPVSGFCRTLSREHPEMRCTLVDLSARPDDAEIELLLGYLSRDTAEHELVLRAAVAWVPRLRRRGAEAAASSNTEMGVPSGPFRLDSTQRGVLTSLALKPVPRRAPKAGEVEIAVRAAGVNFRDVMKALGIYPTAPGDIPWYGDECAGEVVQVGEGVTSLEPGDRVVAMAPAAFAEFVTTPAAFARPVPDGVSDAEAAGLLVAFSTAHHGLVDLARLKKGETVLIHGGAGGVGMAAIQVARDAGAEIFATAGTPARRELLLSMGVSRALDSRTLAFADQVVELTGRRGVDVVLNSLAGEALRRSFALLAPFGRFVEIGKKDIFQNHKLDLQPFMRNLSFFSIDIERVFRERPEQGAALLNRVLERVAEGRYPPLPITEYPITEARKAFRHLAQSQHVGKLVLSMPSRRRQAQHGRFRSDATYLITGGTGALGLWAARSMVEQGARHLVLCSRRRAEGAAETAIAGLRAAGANVRTVILDVADAAAVHALVGDIGREGPPLHGALHAAGVVDDGIVIKQTAARCRAVMRPKIAGGWNLHAATRELSLDFFVTFSSVASVLGSPGQASYAAGNAFLDALAGLRRQMGLPALNVNWGPWGESGMAARTATGSVLKLIRPLAPKEAVDILWRLLDEGAAEDTVVLDVDWRRFFQAYPALRRVTLLRDFSGPAEAPAAGESSLLAKQLRAASRDERVSTLAALVRNRLATILGTSESNIPITEQLPNLGVDSLMAVELHNQLERELGQAIPRMVLAQATTVEGVARQVASQLDPLQATPLG
jgi:acyl transferase domain-containing protein/acyl carrier protein